MASTSGASAVSAVRTPTSPVAVVRGSAGSFGLGAQQRNGKRPLLRRGQGRARQVERLAEEVGERNVGELRLALRRTDLEHPVGPVLGSPDHLQPERRLADACLALDQQSEGTRRNPVEEPFDRLQLGLATDYRVHALLVQHSSS